MILIINDSYLPRDKTKGEELKMDFSCCSVHVGVFVGNAWKTDIKSAFLISQLR